MSTAREPERGVVPSPPHLEELSLLTYNVHGLARIIAKDDPGARMPTIGWLAKPFDIVLFQEDYEYHDLLDRELGEEANGYRGNTPWSRPLLAGVKVLSFPFTVWFPDFSPPYGAGISIFVDREHDVTPEALHQPYRDCHGWFSDRSDCWSAKGFQGVRVRAANGAEVDVYNTHLEAGATPEDTAVRRKQLEQLVRAVEQHSKGRALIVAGDFNLAFIRPPDRDIALEFRRRLGLSDAGAAPALRNWRERDMILYRSGSDTEISVVEAGEALEFTSRHRALSDHPALYARFALQAALSKADEVPAAIGTTARVDP